MCLLAAAWRIHANYPLILAANRDEEYARPASFAEEWTEAPEITGGRDLRAGGSWLALSRRGRLAAVTNVREPPAPAATLAAAREGAGADRVGGAGARTGAGEIRSRGELVLDFLRRDEEAERVARQLAASQPLAPSPVPSAIEFGPFNLLLWDGEALVCASNRPQPRWLSLAPGVHGLSNGELGTRWTKVERLTAALTAWVGELPEAAGAAPATDALWKALADERPAADQDLPDTGVGLELERRLSAPFLRGDRYGTRASTLVLVRRDGQTEFIERNFGPGGLPLAERRLRMTLEWPLR